MARAGEVSQEIGRSYVQVLTDALQAVVPAFHATFNVYEYPEKLSFRTPDWAFAFDVRGIIDEPHRVEVFIECKARTVGTDLLAAYREFLAKSWLTAARDEHREDLFWFATNVPFGCDAGLHLTSLDFVREQLTVDSRTGRWASDLPDIGLSAFAKRVSVCVLTDSQMRRMNLAHYVRPGETLWDITKSLHGFQLPPNATDMFQPYSGRIARMSNLADANLLTPGDRLLIPWEGIAVTDAELH